MFCLSNAPEDCEKALGVGDDFHGIKNGTREGDIPACVLGHTKKLLSRANSDIEASLEGYANLLA